MMRRCSALWLALLLTIPALGEVIPPSSRPHAARMDAWRAMLDAADDARRSARPEEAEQIYTEIIDAAATFEKENLLVARALDGLADLCVAQGRLAEAQGHYRRAAGLWEKLLGPQQPRLATTLHNLAVVELELDQLEAARSHVLAALEIWGRSFGAQSAQAQDSRDVHQRVVSRLRQDEGHENRTP